MAELKLKRYELLSDLDVSVPIFTQISKNQQVRQTKRPMYALHLKYTFPDENGDNKTLRLKLNSNTVNQEEQIKQGILANDKFTQKERMAVRFHNGTLLTSLPTVQNYLESIPPFQDFKGVRDGSAAQKPAYRLVDEAKSIDEENDLIVKQLEAANYVMSLNQSDAEELMISLFGSAHEIPANLKAIKNDLVSYINEFEDAPEKILQNRESQDDKTKVLIGKAVKAGILSFDDVKDQAAFKISGKWKGIRSIPSDFDLSEKESRLIEYLNSKEGEAHRTDLETNLKKAAVKKPAAK